MRSNHDIEYKIYGEEMQYVEVELDPEETAVAESGSFMFMDDGIQMQTIFGDGSAQQGGILGKLMSAGKRILTGESLFMTAFTNVGQGKKKVSFASPYPGKIIAVDLIEMGGRIICQKDAFLCAAKGSDRRHCPSAPAGDRAFWRRRDLSCKSLKEMVLLSCMQADMFLNAVYRPVKY